MFNAAKRVCNKVANRGNRGNRKRGTTSTSGSNLNDSTHVSEISPDNNIDYEQLQEDFGIEDNELEMEDEIPLTPSSVGAASRGGGRGASSRPPVAPTSNRRKRSKVWKFFEDIPNSDRVKCKLCNDTFKHKTGGQLGGLGHLVDI